MLESFVCFQRLPVDLQRKIVNEYFAGSAWLLLRRVKALLPLMSTGKFCYPLALRHTEWLEYPEPGTPQQQFVFDHLRPIVSTGGSGEGPIHVHRFSLMVVDRMFEFARLQFHAHSCIDMLSLRVSAEEEHVWYHVTQPVCVDKPDKILRVKTEITEPAEGLRQITHWKEGVPEFTSMLVRGEMVDQWATFSPTIQKITLMNVKCATIDLGWFRCQTLILYNVCAKVIWTDQPHRFTSLNLDVHYPENLFATDALFLRTDISPVTLHQPILQCHIILDQCTTITCLAPIQRMNITYRATFELPCGKFLRVANDHWVKRMVLKCFFDSFHLRVARRRTLYLLEEEGSFRKRFDHLANVIHLRPYATTDQVVHEPDFLVRYFHHVKGKVELEHVEF